ncbi:MAG: ribonuclease P protein component [Magnetovibrio sp.]|nr:ribonuclease P protein component [Magnetovibrio sp.]
MPIKGSDLPRLKSRQEFLYVARGGLKCAAPGLVLQMRQSVKFKKKDRAVRHSLVHSPRIGYTVSRKVGNAVNRNRVKRRLRAVAHEVMPEHACSSADFVIIGRFATRTRPFRLLVQDLKKALQKLDCYKD